MQTARRAGRPVAVVDTHLDGDIAGRAALARVAATLGRVCVGAVAAGFMTRERALLLGPDPGWMTARQFLDTLDAGLQAAMG